MASASMHFEPANLSRLIGLGYEAALTHSAWQLFADELVAISGSQMAMIQYIEDGCPERSFMVCGGLGNDFHETFAETSWLSEDDHFWTAIRNQPPGTVRLGHEIVMPEAMHKSPEYARVAMPWKLEHFLISAITTGNGISAFLSLGRTAKAAPFVAGDKKGFSQLILAHLRRSMVFHREFTAARRTTAVLSAVFDRAPYGMVIFDARGQPIAVNDTASKVFASGDGLALVNGRLHASDPTTHAKLESALSIALQTALGVLIAPPEPVMVPRRSNTSSPYQVMLSQMPLRDDTTGFPAGSAVVALIVDGWPVNFPVLPMLMRSTYGLTPAEVRLCQVLLDGRSLADAAESLGVSRNTAKTHLTRTFDKTGVRTQAALLNLLSRGTRK